MSPAKKITLRDRALRVIIVSSFVVDVINELTDLTDVSKQGLKLMKIVILGPLGAQGGYLELARPCHRITLIELDLISSTSHY